MKKMLSSFILLSVILFSCFSLSACNMGESNKSDDKILGAWTTTSQDEYADEYPIIFFSDGTGAGSILMQADVDGTIKAHGESFVKWSYLSKEQLYRTEKENGENLYWKIQINGDSMVITPYGYTQINNISVQPVTYKRTTIQ